MRNMTGRASGKPDALPFCVGKPALCALKLYGAEDRLYSFFRLILLLVSAQLFQLRRFRSGFAAVWDRKMHNPMMAR